MGCLLRLVLVTVRFKINRSRGTYTFSVVLPRTASRIRLCSSSTLLPSLCAGTRVKHMAVHQDRELGIQRVPLKQLTDPSWLSLVDRQQIDILMHRFIVSTYVPSRLQKEGINSRYVIFCFDLDLRLSTVKKQALAVTHKDVVGSQGEGQWWVAVHASQSRRGACKRQLNLTACLPPFRINS